MKTKFTQGSWTVFRTGKEKTENQQVYAIEERKEHRLIHIAQITSQSQHPDEEMANAKLIASAPELFKKLDLAQYILKELQNRFKWDNNNEVPKTIKKIDLLLKKITE